MSNERRRIVRNVADDFVDAETNAHYAKFLTGRSGAKLEQLHSCGEVGPQQIIAGKD